MISTNKRTTKPDRFGDDLMITVDGDTEAGREALEILAKSHAFRHRMAGLTPIVGIVVGAITTIGVAYLWMT